MPVVNRPQHANGRLGQPVTKLDIQSHKTRNTPNARRTKQVHLAAGEQRTREREPLLAGSSVRERTRDAGPHRDRPNSSPSKAHQQHRQHIPGFFRNLFTYP